MSLIETKKINSNLSEPLDVQAQRIHDSLYNRITSRAQYSEVLHMGFETSATVGIHIDGCGQIEMYFWTSTRDDLLITVDGVTINRYVALLDGYSQAKISRPIHFSQNFDLKSTSNAYTGIAVVYLK